MAYSGTCTCGNVEFSFPHDPMMQFQCHCSKCQIAFGSSLSALAMPESEIECKGELKIYTVQGGSGNKMHYYRCAECGVLIYNKPELLEGMIYIPAGLVADQLEFTPTVELWTANKPDWINSPASIVASFEDNGTTERLIELLENLDQRE